MKSFLKKFSHKIQVFFKAVVRSCYDMEFYRGVRIAPWTRAIRYAVAFHFMLAVIATSMLMPAAIVGRSALLAHLQKSFPDDAAMTVHSGVLSTTLAMPYEMGDASMHVIVDTTKTGTDYPDTIGKSAGIIVGRDAVFMTDDQNLQHTFLLRQSPDFSVTKSGIVDWLARYGLLAAILGSLAFGFLYWGMLLAITALTVAFFSLLSMLFAKIWKVSMSYKTLFTVGLHAVTLPILANLGLGALGLNIPYAYTVIYFLVISAVIADERSQPIGGVKPEVQSPKLGVDGPPEPKNEDAEPHDGAKK